MLHDNEKDNHEYQTLEADPYLQDLVKIFD